MQEKILIVEDDRSFGTMLHRWFVRNGYATTLCDGMVSAKKILTEQNTFNIILTDLRLVDGDGIMLLTWIKEMNMPVPVIIMTGYGEVQTAVSAIKLGAFDFLEKPINPSILTKKIEAAFELSKLSKDTVKPKKLDSNKNRDTGSKIVEGQTELYRQMYSYIDLVAPTQMAVMVVGESGTGKEHVAHMIHDRSNRSGGPFVAVDCGSLSTELAPSELFGHKKGSFTSAIEDKTGFFWEANGGTLFLDEVGNLPYGVQMQILRSLQEKRIRPIGTSNDIEVDVRIITATNENLEQAIALGKFREDLYHRLNEFMIKVPSLRDCVDDIPLYAEYFMKEANYELDKDVRYISSDAMYILKKYNWPGNLRELRNVIRRSVLFSTGDTISNDGLPILSRPDNEDLGIGVFASSNNDFSLYSKPEDEKERIIKALEKANGNKTRAAKMLNIDRKTLYNKLHLYKIGL